MPPPVGESEPERPLSSEPERCSPDPERSPPPSDPRRSTLEWRDSTDPSKENAGQRQLAEVIPLGGGYPINVGNDTIGALGISGSPTQEADEKCATAGIAAAANSLK